MRLNHLTDKELLLDTKRLVKEEREILSRVLWHLKEIDQRKLYSTQSCGSLFEYCVKVLNYSEGQASRRVSACRLLREMPEISSKIEDGSLNLTQLNQAKNFFHEENITDKNLRKKVIRLIEGQTTRETEKILWNLKSDDTPKKVTLTIKEETFNKIKKIQALKAHICPDVDSLLELACAELEKIWNPEFKNLKRSSQPAKIHSRYISQKYKNFVWKRDKSKCRICGSIYALQIDHIKPFAIGGKSEPENLRLLCRNCNQRKRIEFFGTQPFLKLD
jgi:hypothetical protein